MLTYCSQGSFAEGSDGLSCPSQRAGSRCSAPTSVHGRGGSSACLPFSQILGRPDPVYTNPYFRVLCIAVNTEPSHPHAHLFLFPLRSLPPSSSLGLKQVPLPKCPPCVSPPRFCRSWTLSPVFQGQEVLYNNNNNKKVKSQQRMAGWNSSSWSARQDCPMGGIDIWARQTPVAPECRLGVFLVHCTGFKAKSSLFLLCMTTFPEHQQILIIANTAVKHFPLFTCFKTIGICADKHTFGICTCPSPPPSPTQRYFLPSTNQVPFFLRLHPSSWWGDRTVHPVSYIWEDREFPGGIFPPIERFRKISICPGLLEPGQLVPGFVFNEKFCWLTICVQSNEEQSQLKIIGTLCYCL